MLKGKNSVTRTGFETRSLTLDLVWEPEDPGHEAERPGLLQSIKKHFKPEFGIFDIFEVRMLKQMDDKNLDLRSAVFRDSF